MPQALSAIVKFQHLLQKNESLDLTHHSKLMALTCTTLLDCVCQMLNLLPDSSLMLKFHKSWTSSSIHLNSNYLREGWGDL